MTDIRFSPQAIEDLRETKAYITNELYSAQAAENTISKIMNRIRILADFPESGPPLSSIIDVDTNYRFLVCGNYTAFYRYEDGIVYIVRILYGRRDFMRILFEEPEEN